MKILLIHNYYQNSGGEDTVVANEKSLLMENGHQVELYSDDNHRIKSSCEKLKVAIALPGSKQSHKDLTNIVREFRPDIIHAHNLFPLITATAYDVAIENRVPIVQTLHNYRVICSAGTLFRDNKTCELCIEKSPYNAVRYKCYRGSSLGSLAVARMIDKHRRLKVWSNKVDRFIALTDFAKSKLQEADIPAEKITVKPNYVTRQNISDNKQSRDSAIFVGRLSPEKGIETLIETWMAKNEKTLPKLKIIGDGPLLKIMKHRCRKSENIDFLGQQPSIVVKQEMDKSNFLVFPSVCYEGFPMVILEAFAKGLPVICSKLGSMTSIIEDKVTGLYFKPNSSQDLLDKLNYIIENDDLLNTMRQNCQSVFLDKYTPEKNYMKLMSIYSRVIEEYPLINNA